MHKSQKLVLARAWGFKSPLPHHIFLAILAVMKKGGDDRRPVKPPCGTFVARITKNSLQLSRVRRLSYVFTGENLGFGKQSTLGIELLLP